MQIRIFLPRSIISQFFIAKGPAKKSKAYELATKARQKAYPKDAELAKTLGILNFQRGFYPQSVELLNQASATRID